MAPTTAAADRQRALRARCRHATGEFMPFAREEVEQSIPARFEQQVRRHPLRRAVATGPHALTYAALDQEADRVAHALDRLAPTQPSPPIGLLFEHGAPAIVAMLGALKAGRCYLPLDPTLPPARLQFLIDDAGADALLTDARHRDLARTLVREAGVIDVDALGQRAGEPGERRPPTPDTLFALLYTSGSTGRPKGVVHTHRNMLDMIRKYTNILGICPDDHLALLASTSFNTSVMDIFGALLNGAAVHPFNVRHEGVPRLSAWLREEGISLYHSVPTLFRQLMDTLTGHERFPALRAIQLGGEPLYRRDVERYKARFDRRCLLVNGLGCTELSLNRQFFMDHDTELTDGRVPVGYPVEPGEVLLLDDGGEEVRGEGTGEIVLRSPYLALGYWGRPDLAHAFAPDPRGGEERRYRTGDLGRLASDGCLTHLGRKDFQAKIRGHRVEVEEVELALRELAAVREAAVTAGEDPAGDQRLVAYVVPAAQPAPTVTALRGDLARVLPDYMVPAVFVMVDHLPLTDAGKVDRRALPAPDRSRPSLAHPYTAPRTPIEGILATVWAEVLGLDRVGIHDDFLALGGNSLLATQVLSRAHRRFGADLPLHAFLAAGTVAEMAIVVVASHAALPRLLAELEGDAHAEEH